MKKFIVCFLILQSFVLAGIFPIFNGSRDEWIMMKYYGESIEVDSGSLLGLTCSTSGSIDYSFKFYSQNNISYDIPDVLPTNVFTNIDSQNLYVYGTFIGPGNIFNGIVMSGNGNVFVYEKNFSTNAFDYIGSFNINGVPEPSSLFLFSTGVIFLMRKK